MATSRPKRNAATKSTIVELSSESENEGEPSSKRTKGEDDDGTSNDSDFRIEGSKIVIVEKPAPRKRKIAKPKTISNDENDGCIMSVFNPHPWQIHELLSERAFISPFSSRNIVQLFQNDNTIPFICRYRRDLIGKDITPEKLRDIKTCYTEIVSLQKRADTIIKHLENEKQLTENIRKELLGARTSEELEFLYAPYKPANKGSLADRAKELGLEKYAENILFGETLIRLEPLLNRNTEGLCSFEKISEGLMHIISHIISKNTEVLEELRRIQKVHRIVLKSTHSKTSKKEPKNANNNNNGGNKEKIQRNDEHKYELYFNFENGIRYIKPHQILAINRGEKLKYLSVKIIIPDRVKNEMKHFVRRLFLTNGMRYQLRNDLFEKSYEDCYTKKLQPFLSRQVRSDLNELAKKASIEVFAKNLKQLLLMSPMKGEKILGIDPGFSNGCKLALISETADVLETGVIYPHTRSGNSDEYGEKLAAMLEKNGSKVIALGNGTACRETEFWLSNLFKDGILDANKIQYSIVSEQGASVYSCSEVAKKEFPKLDVNLVSAVSIARRLNDPLSEYVKIEPRHIGVGMYQHDVNEKSLSESLNEVVTECVSFVGVDINTASISLLKYIAGLTNARAEKLIEYRNKNGPFRTRRAIVKVKSIGEKTFTQCAGFIRIDPKSAGGNISNLLDCTWVHPESYDIAKKIIDKCNLKLKDIGETHFINKIKEFTTLSSIENCSKEFDLPKERIDIILEGLKRELFQDYRSDFDKKPLFKQGITKMTDLKKNCLVTGAVTNITHFGAFVDIGVEQDGLIHTSKMNGMILNIGDRVEAFVIDVDPIRKRVSLQLENMAI